MDRKESGTYPVVLLVEDNAADILLLHEALEDFSMNIDLQVVHNGEEAVKYLHRREPYGDAEMPDLILLDLNLPRVNGFEVLEMIKQDNLLKHIPVIVLSTSQAEEDINRSYQLHANCFITKPLNLDRFMDVVGDIGSFWLSIVRLPTK